MIKILNSFATVCAVISCICLFITVFGPIKLEQYSLMFGIVFSLTAFLVRLIYEAFLVF